MAAAAMKLACAVVLCMVVVAPYGGEATLSCGTVDRTLMPCMEYLQGRATLSGSCCSGVSALNRAATTTADRQAACKCLKQASSAISGLNEANAENLPGKCHVNITYKISPSTNCNSVK